MRRKLSALFLCLLLLCSCSAKGMPANQWLLEQDTVSDDLQQASISISDLFSLFLVGSIGKSDFETEIDLLIASLQLSQLKYQDTQKGIEPGSHSYSSKCGQEALDNAYAITLDFLSVSKTVLDDPSVLAHHYLEWRDSFLTQIAAYLTAITFIEESGD